MSLLLLLLSDMIADHRGFDAAGTELSEIQKQIDNLSVKTDPQSVGQLLTLRRDVLFLEFDVAVRHSVRETFLATGNVSAYKVHYHQTNNNNNNKPTISNAP